MKRINKTLLFLCFTFSFSYILVGIFLLFGDDLKTIPGFIMVTAFMFTPMLSVIIIEKLIYKEKIQKYLNISFKINKWFVVAWLIMPIICFGAFAIALLLPGVGYSPDLSGIMKQFESMMTPEQLEQMKSSIDTLPFNPIWIVLLQGLFAGITLNAILGFGEEIGWRGFLLQQFKNMSFFKASITIGLIWGIWHTPLILLGHNYPQHSQIGVLMMVIWCILLTPIFIYITLKSKSVISASIMHGTLNGTAGIAVMLIKGGNDLLIGITGLAGFIALAFILCWLYIYDNWIGKDKIMKNIIGNYLN